MRMYGMFRLFHDTLKQNRLTVDIVSKILESGKISLAEKRIISSVMLE